MSRRAFSVVVCSDGRLPFLQATHQGLRGLDYRNFELCLVLGPTRDGAREWAESLAPQVKIAHCPARNLSRARNLGIALAAGEVVAFLDDDAVPEPEWLAELDRAYDDPDIVAAGGVVYDAAGLAFQARFVTVDRLGYPHSHWVAPAERLNFPHSPEFPHLLGANCSFRRRTLIELGGFDEEYEYFLDETDLIARVNDSGGRIAQLGRAAVHHRPAPSPIRTAKGVTRHWRPLIKNRLYFALRNGALHHSIAEILRAAADDAEGFRANVERDGSCDDLRRLDEQTRSGVAAGLLAAQRPRKLMDAAARCAPPPAFLPFALPEPERGRLCLALVTQDYPPGHNGGVARNTQELAQAFAALGHRPHVFTAARGAPSLDFEAGVWVHRTARRDAGPPPDPAIPQAVWDHSRTMFDEVARLDARRRVDWVYAPLWDCEPVAFLREPRFPLVCALQTTMDFWLDSQPAQRRNAEWMRARGDPLLALERWILARAPLLHANSRAIVEDIAQRYGLEFDAARLVYAPHGLADWAAGAPEPREDWGARGAPLPGPTPQGGREEVCAECRFLFVGRLESRKGVDTLLAAAPDVLRRFPHARLDIVGDDTIPRAEGGTYRAAFAAQDARIVFHGRVEEAALRAHYRDCDVLVAPSRYESFGLVFVEGMMFSKPVVAGAAGGAREVVVDGETGLLVPPGDRQALAEAMTRLAQNPALRRAMGEAGRRRYETHYRAEAAARALLDGLAAQPNTSLITAT